MEQGIAKGPDFSLSSDGIAIVHKPDLPLARFKVLDLTQARSGATAVRQFADWGAEVVKSATFRYFTMRSIPTTLPPQLSEMQVTNECM